VKLPKLITIGATLLASGAALLAQDGAAMYKKRCSGCHGMSAEGKAAMKAPAIKGTKVDLTAHLMKGAASSKPPHNKAMTGMTDADAKAIGDYLKGLK
jgi:cytochrome c553